MVDPMVVEEQFQVGPVEPAPMIRSMGTFVFGTIFTGFGLAVVLDAISGLSFGQTASLAGLTGALVVLVAAVVRARSQSGTVAAPAPAAPSPVAPTPTPTPAAAESPTVLDESDDLDDLFEPDED